MIHQLHQHLRPIRRRLSRQRAMGPVASALLIGGWLALVAALLTLLGGSMTSGLIGAAVAVGFPLLALAWALWHGANWQQAARLIDRRLQLQDRTATALHLARNDAGDPFAVLQVEDAVAHLHSANIKGIRFSLPLRRLASGLLLTLFSLSLIAWGIIAPPTGAIQTSGDIQDIRPEVIERRAIELTPLSPEALAAGASLSAHDQIPKEKRNIDTSHIEANYFRLLTESSE